MNENVGTEFNKDLLTLYVCHKTQLEIKNRPLKELYMLLEFYMLTVTLYEFIKANNIQDCIPKEDWRFLLKWRKRLLKKHAVSGSNTVEYLAREMQIDFDHYFIESIVTVNTESGELLGINFGTYDLQIFDDNDWRIVNELIATVIQGLDKQYDRATIVNIGSYCKIYAAVVERHITAQHFYYASGVMFKHPEPCEEDKYLIMYYYTLLKLASMADIFLPSLYADSDNSVGNNYRVSVMKIKAEMIESFGECIKTAKTPLARDIAVRINNHLDPTVFALNRKLRSNLHYKWNNDFTIEELEKIDRFQRRYFDMVFMSFNERLNIKVGRGYRVIMWIADHTDTEHVKARRQTRKKENSAIKIDVEERPH